MADQTIQFKRRIPGTGAAATLAQGEPSTAITAAGVAELYIGDGTAVRTLVHSSRQLEMTGNQPNVNGIKTFAATGGINIAPGTAAGGLQLTGGFDGDILTTDGLGHLTWTEPPKGVETGTTPPATATAGDLFFNSTSHRLMVYNGTAWVAANAVIVATTAPSGQPSGTAWLNSDNGHLQIWDGSVWHPATGGRSSIGASAPTSPQPAQGDIWWSPTGPQIYDGSAWDDAVLPGIETATTAPATASTGDMYYNTTTHKLMVYDGATWNAVNGVTVASSAPSGLPAGSIWLNDSTHVLSVYDGSAWVATGFTEPSGGAAAYGRTTAGAWEAVLPLTGGTLSGALTAQNGVTVSGGMITVGAATGTPPAGSVNVADTFYINGVPIEAGGLTTVTANAPLAGTGTAGNALTVTAATAAQIITGTDNTYPVTSIRLRDVVGADVATLDTSNKTLVPAINELDTELKALVQELAAISGALRFVGNYDADINQVTDAQAGTLTVNAALPAGADGNEGWFVIVIEAGTGTAPAPTKEMHDGDWIVSTGTGGWLHVPLYHVAMTATNVGITQINAQTWTNVQQALAGLYTLAAAAMTTVNVDGTSITGNGTTTALSVTVIDGGTY